MTSSKDQAESVAAFHALSEELPGRSLPDWHSLVRGWKARMKVEIVVGELRQLINRCESAERKVADCERFATKHPSGDALRRVLYPSKFPAPPDETCPFCDRVLQPYSECWCGKKT